MNRHAAHFYWRLFEAKKDELSEHLPYKILSANVDFKRDRATGKTIWLLKLTTDKPNRPSKFYRYVRDLEHEYRHLYGILLPWELQ